MTKEEIIKKISESNTELNKFDVLTLSLFGSFVNNSNNDNSDIDFLVQFSHNTFRNYIGLRDYLQKRFKKNIDLVCENSLDDRMVVYINKLVLWQKN